MRRSFPSPDLEIEASRTHTAGGLVRTPRPGRHGLPHRFAAPDVDRFATVVPTPVDWEGVRRHTRRS